MKEQERQRKVEEIKIKYSPSSSSSSSYLSAHGLSSLPPLSSFFLYALDISLPWAQKKKVFILGKRRMLKRKGEKNGGNSAPPPPPPPPETKRMFAERGLIRRVRTKKEKCSLIECRNLIWAAIMGFDFFSLGGGDDESYQRKSLVSQTLILLFWRVFQTCSQDRMRSLFDFSKVVTQRRRI